MPRARKPDNDNDGPTSPPSLVRDVTPENYWTKVKAFMSQGVAAEAPNIPFVIARAEWKRDGEKQPPTPRQWGAWLSYFLRHRIRMPIMAVEDHWYVPAEWPHLFDADETVHADHLAGDAFLRLYDPKWRTGNFIPDAHLGFRKVARKPPAGNDNGAAKPPRPLPEWWQKDEP